MLRSGVMETTSAAFFRGAVAVALLSIALGLPVAAAKTGVEAVDRLRHAGAVSLALHLIDREQPTFSGSPVSWQRWERQRLAILESRQDWPAVVARVADYPVSLPDDFRVSAKESAARSHLAMGDADAFRAGHLGVMDYYRMRNIKADTEMRDSLGKLDDHPPEEPK